MFDGFLFVTIYSREAYIKNPKFEVAKRLTKGKTVEICEPDNPNQEASVAPYCSMEVVGIQRPRGFEPESVSSGPPKASVGYVP